MKEVKNKEEKISDALLKVALGYQVAEVTEEYAEVDGELKLTKRKKTKKDVPPDLKAVQLLLSTENDGDYADWTDEQLQAEKKRLLAELKEKQASTEGAQENSLKTAKTLFPLILPLIPPLPLLRITPMLPTLCITAAS